MIKENVEFEAGGKLRGWRFGTYSIKIISERTGVKDIAEIFRLMAEQDLTIILAFYYACAVTYAHHKGQEVDFKEVDVSEWVEEIGFEKANEYSLRLTSQYLPKNLNPPAENPGESSQ